MVYQDVKSVHLVEGTFNEDNKTHNARCTYNITEGLVLDGDCIQEGWRIDGGGPTW